MASIEIDRITKNFAGDATGSGPPALGGVSMKIADGETISIVGSSGCGKSTLLKVVAGLEEANSGRVLYNGEDMTKVSPQKRGIGMVFQDYALYPSMKGKGNLAYYFQVNQRTEEEATQRTKEVAELMGVGFDQLLGQAPTTLSGGEQQRVAIARCIVREPQLFLMDEPICNLDAKLRERTRLEIKKLLKKFGITTLYVTHDQQEAIFMGDRIAVMRDGIVEQIGAFDDLYYSPANLFVATFLGTPPLAVLPATVTGPSIMVDQASWPLPATVRPVLPDGPIRLGVRPEGWLIGQPGGAELPVRQLERIPSERVCYAHGTLAGVNLTVIADLDHPQGRPLAITPDLDRAYFFAADSEKPIHVPGPLDLF
ncbi:ABC transporter ATP-binding protein [Microlunatus parietis]|uniref:ABC-type sugar transport system ATPase subunit n=1 Tax=Microlunatus parietis TaxID=682979 RepID=A0A7Y9ICY2_9ACTN|nr:ABC transporter ATP-binding protein [Microlunatus parietis]NYE74532.1 ABC-type sugar transport system ATPase subunit [Microlunatus parietis]